MIYFTMQQGLYGISKYFKYNLRQNQTSQTNQIQSFMIHFIQFNEKSQKLFSIIEKTSIEKYFLVEINSETLEIENELLEISEYGRPMSGYYFNSKKQYLIYHVYDSNLSQTRLITLDLSKNPKQRFIQSKKFDFNVYSLSYIQSDPTFLALWQYNIVTPLVAIQINEKTGKQIQNVTITPTGQRISQGFKPFSVDYQNKILYVLSWTDDLSKTFISKVSFQTMKLNLITIQGKLPKDYIFFKKD
ncbi:unnamed protein product [Adineta ricciae]|uniref:Uncharacterized protein n=1 Tax=Adineta ricciae TaxID=249248 RepID=A0A815V1J3_ADIRI|nr:unnamed protein product [Adineta ricciae]CAF1526315.1 unnamed protein product [Adineta ricciae]